MAKLTIQQSFGIEEPQVQWFWSIEMDDGHLFCMSKQFPAIDDVVADVFWHGRKRLQSVIEIEETRNAGRMPQPECPTHSRHFPDSDCSDCNFITIRVIELTEDQRRRLTVDIDRIPA